MLYDIRYVNGSDKQYRCIVQASNDVEAMDKVKKLKKFTAIISCNWLDCDLIT